MCRWAQIKEIEKITQIYSAATVVQRRGFLSNATMTAGFSCPQNA